MAGFIGNKNQWIFKNWKKIGGEWSFENFCEISFNHVKFPLKLSEKWENIEKLKNALN
jgi:hypothetical protein